jgi:hypothetical protein
MASSGPFPPGGFPCARRVILAGFFALFTVLALAATPATAQEGRAQAEIVESKECVTYPETGTPDLQYCVMRHFEYVSKDGEPLVINEFISYTYTIINGEPVNCTQAEHIVIANGAIRREQGRFTCS